MAPFGGENAASYYDEGLTASVKGDLGRAVQCFQQSVALDGSFLPAHHQLAKCYLRLGKVQAAADLLGKVVATKPDLGPARLDLGHALIELNRLDEARKQFLGVLEAQLGNARASLGLATVCFLEGNWSKAVALALEARAKGGDHFAVLFLLGRAARLIRPSADGRLPGAADVSARALEDADALLEKLAEANTNRPEAYFLRGEVAFAREDFTAALEHYRAADSRADDGQVYSSYGERFSRLDILAKRGLCLQRLGEPGLAREMGERIVQVDPNHKIGQALAAL